MLHTSFLIGPWGYISLFTVYIALTISALFFVYKEEKGFTAFFWTLFILFIPVISSLAYLLKYFINQRIRQIAK